MNLLERHIEALIFCTQDPLSEEELGQSLSALSGTEIPREHISKTLQGLIEKYKSPDYSFEIVKAGGGYRFLTKPEYRDSISQLLIQKSKKKLSVSALETLAVIAYKQPISKSEVEEIRGVNCDYAVQKLLEKELIEIRGRSEKPGRPVIYGTAVRFNEYFGINSPDELPRPKDFAPESEIGIENKE